MTYSRLFDRILCVYSDASPAVRHSGSWLISHEYEEALRQIRSAIGTSAVPIYEASEDLPLPNRLFGLPVVWAPLHDLEIIELA